MFTPTKQYPSMSGNSTGAASGATNSRREDYTVNGETWFPMLPSHNPTPEMLARARSLAAEAWQRRDAVIEAGYHNGGIDHRALDAANIEWEQAEQWVEDVCDLLYPSRIDITVEVGA